MAEPIIQEIRATDFPELFTIAQPPPSLWVQGLPQGMELLSQLPERGLSIVGSRHCQPRSLSLIQNTLKDLRGFELIVVSGLAKGVDGQAHRCAISAGLPTVAILGCGLSVSYPPENDELRSEILKAGGLIVSEFPLEAPPKAHHFIQRNRIIAGWAKAIWIVEAGFRSGAINSASWAKKQERTCYVTPCYPGDLVFAGNQRILEQNQVAEGAVRPFWGAQSLGETWLELNGFLSNKTARSQKKFEASKSQPESEIFKKISESTVATGGISLGELQDWSTTQRIPSEFFHEHLRRELERGHIVIKKGIFIRKQEF